MPQEISNTTIHKQRNELINLRMFIVVHLRFIAYCPQIPESDDLLIIIYKKDVEPVPVTRSTFRGLRIAQFVETSNAEAPRRYVYNNLSVLINYKVR